jgi:hypothetical protein
MISSRPSLCVVCFLYWLQAIRLKMNPFALQAPFGCGVFCSKSVQLKVLHQAQGDVLLRMWVDKLRDKPLP